MTGAVLAGSGLFAASVTLAFLAVMPMPRRTARAAAVIGRYARRRPDAPPRETLPKWPRVLALRLSRPGVTVSLQRRLDAAGNPGSWTADRVLAAKGLTMLVLAGTGVLYGIRSPQMIIVGAVTGAAAGLFLPDVLLYNAASRRRQAIAEAMPDAVDLLSICMEAGLGFNDALARTAAGVAGPLGTEVARAMREIDIGRARSVALRDMADRSGVAELRTFIAALVQAGELGIPVTSVLREQSVQMRLRRRQRAEEKAQQVTVKILFPLIFCLFPALFVFVLGPGVLQLITTLGIH